MNAATGAFVNGADRERLPTWPMVSIVFLVIASALFPAGLVTAMNLYLLFLAALVWTASGMRLNRSLLWMVTPFAAILAIGMIVGLGADRYLYLKDAWYVVNPVVVMSIGFVLHYSMPDIGRGLKAFVISGALLSLLHLIPIAMHPEILIYSANRIRSMAGLGYIVSSLAFVILAAYFGRWREGLGLRPGLGWICLLLCLASIVASFSRTAFVVAVVGAMAGAGFFARRELPRLGMLAVVVAVAALGLGLIQDLDSSDSRQSFIGKLEHSLDEMTVREYVDERSINENWRGYETARALRVVADGPVYGPLIGQGFGAEVSLGRVMMSAQSGQAMHEIPILHNGFAYLLVKGGMLAILAYLVFLGRLYWIGRRLALAAPNVGTIPAARVLQGLAVGLAFTTWVVSGAFNKSAIFPLLLAIGFLLPALGRYDETAVAPDGAATREVQ